LRARPIVKALAQRERGLPHEAAESFHLDLRLETIVLGAAVEKDRTDIANVSVEQRAAVTCVR